MKSTVGPSRKEPEFEYYVRPERRILLRVSVEAVEQFCPAADKEWQANPALEGLRSGSGDFDFLTASARMKPCLPPRGSGRPPVSFFGGKMNGKESKAFYYSRNPERSICVQSAPPMTRSHIILVSGTTTIWYTVSSFCAPPSSSGVSMISIIF